MKRWQCEDCAKVCLDTEMLRAPNPFDPDDEVLGCPSCKSVCEWMELCDEPVCMREASCGWPTKDGGYRRTCFKHSDFEKVLS